MATLLGRLAVQSRPSPVEVPFAGLPLTAESPEGDFAVLAATSVAGWLGNPQHDFALGS